ncbi:MSH2 protein [Malassezia sp. CBS 17886]|nr:MSH2 protein [Malassezia sp. CBS 17886]
MSGHMYPTEEARDHAQKNGSDKTDAGFVAFVRSMPPAVRGTVRLFDRQCTVLTHQEFYSVHGADAIFVADTVFKTQSVLKYLGGKSNSAEGGGLASCTLTIPTAKSFLRDALTARQLRVEIWVPDSGTGRRSGQWSLGKQASPGNLQDVEDLLFLHAEVDSSPVVLALRVKTHEGQTVVGAAFADATNREIGVAEFVDSDLFSNTESLLIQLGAKECLLPTDQGDYDLTKLRAVVDRCSCVVTEMARTAYAAKSTEQDLRRLLHADAGVAPPELDLRLAMSSMAALISYLGLLEYESNFGQFRLRPHDLSEFLRLDNAAMQALSLFPDTHGAGPSQRTTSVFGLLHRCRTAQGTRLLQQWLKQPLVQEHAIRNRQALLQIFVDDMETRQLLQEEYLRVLPDMLRISKRFQRGAATLEDVVRCYQAVERVPGLVDALAGIPIASAEDRVLFASTFVAPLRELHEHLSKLVEMVEMTIDLDELAHHNYVVKPDFDESLGSIKASLDHVRDQLDEQHIGAGRDLALDTEKKLHLENHSTYGYCLRVTRTDAGVLKNRRGYHDIATVKGGVYFTTSALRDLNHEFRALSDQYARTQSRLVKDVIEIAASYSAPLEHLNVVVAHLDVVLSLAQVCSNAPIPYTRPAISAPGTDLVLAEARHPCLEVQDDVHFIANDVRMERGASSFLLITGPNMGGKSTYLRQIGIVVLLAQIGCFVPAAEGAQVPVCDCILARVSAGDSQLKGISTFMAEMLETATILKTATRDSLILIDELGRGTSTYDGFGLAWAISEWIVTQLHCKCVFATHFHELTSLANREPSVQNLHVAAHISPRAGGGSRYDRDITLLYKVEPGASDQSYGIQIAELADFPESVIRLAKRKAEELENFDEATGSAGLPEATEGGVALVEQFLHTWVQKTAERKRARVDSCDAADVDPQADSEAQLAALQECVRDFDERMRANPWTAKLLNDF